MYRNRALGDEPLLLETFDNIAFLIDKPTSTRIAQIECEFYLSGKLFKISPYIERGETITDNVVAILNGEAVEVGCNIQFEK